MLNTYAGLAPELKLLLLCAKTELEEKDLQAMKQLLAGPIDWELFLNLTEHHRLYLLVLWKLSSLANAAVPVKVLSYLRRLRWQDTSKILQMTGELVRVLRALEEKGIRSVVLKGFPLGYLLYGTLALRPARDLDILVWPEELDKAIQVVEDLGYERRHPNSAVPPGQMERWMSTNHHFEYWHQDYETCLELHWRLGHHGLEMPLAVVEDHLTQVQIAGFSMNTLSQEELLLFLVMHGVSHAWFRLKWLCDVEAMLSRGEFSWVRLHELAQRLEVTALLNQALLLAYILLQAPVPPEIVAKIRKDWRARNLVRRARPIISAVNYEPRNLKINRLLYYQRWIYEFSVLLGWRKKLAFLGKLLSPKDKDVELIPLPEDMYFLYYLLRPFTWFYRKIVEL